VVIFAADPAAGSFFRLPEGASGFNTLNNRISVWDRIVEAVIENVKSAVIRIAIALRFSVSILLFSIIL
jgi:hypothetical protein